ncbi:IQ domain-containing protein K-like [Dysidea avara]|uniref:IQ domain-containing protein K-like n=1 Tax=Dysidea avara TaxID=196820 RepID=UPI003331D053
MQTENADNSSSSKPRDYLNTTIFPILTPAINQMLRTAKVTEKRKRFNPLDFLAGYLYRNNPRHLDREGVTLEDIPFVQEEWKINPRPPLPLSATLTELEAVIIIQSHARGFLVRCRPEVQQFRQWQRGLWKERQAVSTIQTHWRKTLSRRQNNT